MAAMTEVGLLDRLRSEGLEGVENVGPPRHQRIYWIVISIFALASAVLAYNLVFTGSDAKRPTLPAITTGNEVAAQPPTSEVAPAVKAQAVAQDAESAFWRIVRDKGAFDYKRAQTELVQYAVDPQLGIWMQRLQVMKLNHQSSVGSTDDHYTILSQDDSHVHFSLCSSSHMKAVDSRTNEVIGEDPQDYNAFKVDVVKTSNGVWKVESLKPAGDLKGTLCTPS